MSKKGTAWVQRPCLKSHGRCHVLKCHNKIQALNLLCDTSFLGHFSLDIAIDGNLTMASPNLAFERCQAKISSNEVKVSNQSSIFKEGKNVDRRSTARSGTWQPAVAHEAPHGRGRAARAVERLSTFRVSYKNAANIFFHWNLRTYIANTLFSTRCIRNSRALSFCWYQNVEFVTVLPFISRQS